MMSDYALINSEVSIPEYGLFADSLPSVSSNDFSIIGNDEEEIETTETIEYIPYNGNYTYFNEIDNAFDVNIFTMFSAFGIGIILLGIVALFKVSINIFNTITK